MDVEKNNGCSEYREVTLTDYGLMVFRLMLGVFILVHGWQKLINFEMLRLVFPDPIGIGSLASLSLIIFAEFVCSILIIIGLFTRLATIPLIVGMSVAAFVIHGNAPFATKELSMLYSVFGVGLLLTGAGRHSVDHVLRNFYSSIWAKCCKKKAINRISKLFLD